MNPGTLLASLIALATLAGAVLHSYHGSSGSTTNDKVRAMERELEVLKAENQTLKAMQQAGGEITLPLDLYTFVEKNLGMEFFPHLKAIKTDDDKIIEAAEYRWIQQFKTAGIENRQYAFELLRILPADSKSYPQQLAELQYNTAIGKVGVYDVQAKELLLSKTFQLDNIAHQVELIRLLTVALLEQHFPADENLTDDAFITRDAIIRGRAEMVAHRYRNIYDKESVVDMSVRIPDKTGSFVKTLALFTTIQGRSYIEKLLLKKREVFPELYEYIPRQSAYIYLDVPFIKKKPKIETPPSIPNQRILIDSELGQVITKALITKLSDKHPDLHLELAYDSFRFTQLIDQPDYPILEWKITWTGEDPAKIFTELFNQNNEFTLATQNGNVVTVQMK